MLTQHRLCVHLRTSVSSLLPLLPWLTHQRLQVHCVTLLIFWILRACSTLHHLSQSHPKQQLTRSSRSVMLPIHNPVFNASSDGKLMVSSEINKLSAVCGGKEWSSRHPLASNLLRASGPTSREKSSFHFTHNIFCTSYVWSHCEYLPIK